MDRNRDRGEVTDLTLQLQVGATCLRFYRGDPDLREYLGGLQGGTERTAEEVARMHRPAPGL